MKNLFSFRAAGFLALVMFMAFNSTSPARACAACMGDTSGSQQGVAATWGIFAMVVIMFGMLGAVVAFGFYLRWREKNPLPDYDELLSDTDVHPKPETNL